MEYSWGGYVMTESRPAGANLLEGWKPKLRWLNNMKGNALLGGIFLVQRRRGACDASSGGDCLQSWSSDPSASLRERRTGNAGSDGGNKDGEHPQFWGRDPVFEPGSSLYRPSLAGQESAFYNASSELSPEGFPYMWTTDGKTPGGDYSLVIDNNVGAARVYSLWAAVDEGAFLDAGTEGLVASVLAYNPAHRLFIYADCRYSWEADGSIRVDSVPPIGVPITVPIVPLVLQASAVVCFVLYAARHLMSGRLLMKRLIGKVSMVTDITGTAHLSNGASRVLVTHAAWDILLAGLLVAAFTANLASVLCSQHITAKTSYDLHDSPQWAQARYVISVVVLILYHLDEADEAPDVIKLLIFTELPAT